MGPQGMRKILGPGRYALECVVEVLTNSPVTSA
jgi:hypothetical protein